MKHGGRRIGAPVVLGRLFCGGGKATVEAPRALQRQDPALPCPIAKLSDDLILHIFDFVQAASSQSAASLALMPPHFYREARCVQHRSVAIDLDDNKHEAAGKRLDLIEKDGLLIAIHELHVLSRHSKPNTQCLQRLAAMVAGMTGLRCALGVYPYARHGA